MIITAQQTNLRQSSRKVRLVANQVKKLGLNQAIEQLAIIQRRSSLAILKVIKQAIANAVNNNHLDIDQLVLTDIIVSDGPIYKRMRAVSRGRGHAIEKRTCHVKVFLSIKDETKNDTVKEVKKEVSQKEAVVKPVAAAAAKEVSSTPVAVKKTATKKTTEKGK